MNDSLPLSYRAAAQALPDRLSTDPCSLHHGAAVFECDTVCALRGRMEFDVTL